MTWFKVDDSFHSHPKVLAADPAALGLWVVAGAWCSANLTDGQVPGYVLPRLIPGSEDLAERLVDCGLWKRVKGGYRFHDWADYNPRSESVKEERAAARERMRNLRAKRRTTAKKTADNPPPSAPETREANDETPAQPPDCSGEQEPNVRHLFVTPTRPDPTRPVLPTEVGREGTAGGAPAARKRATRLPENFTVTDEMKTWFAANCPGVDGPREHAKFVDHFTGAAGAKGVKADWVATWRNWMRRSVDDSTGRRQARPVDNRFRNNPADNRPDDNPFAGAISSSQFTGAAS